ncbi:MAG: aminopeptidase P family protein [Candidatus Omnitrophica bacterium]|nr:aminopeptidase P family protein [Candidatus Omnitrophota bacterium]
MTERFKRLIRQFQVLKVDALLVTDDINIRYLTGFPAHDSWLLVSGRGIFYITDARYAQEAKKSLKGIEVVQLQTSLSDALASLAKRLGTLRLGVDEAHITVSLHKKLRADILKKTVFVPADGCVEALRMVKDLHEIAAIKEALKVNLAAYRFLASKILPGRTEEDILDDLEGFYRQERVTAAFAPIIASGPNSAYPHARVTGRKLRAGEPVLVDMGVSKNAYNSDLTRMFFLGKMPPSYTKVLSILKDSQAAAIKVIRPGMAAKEVDAAARNVLEKHDLAQYFSHSLGHGVGLEIHEMPRLSNRSGAVLSENMVFTVEPGVYFPGRYGVRLEDMVRVTPKGCEVLSVDQH